MTEFMLIAEGEADRTIWKDPEFFDSRAEAIASAQSKDPLPSGKVWVVYELPEGDVLDFAGSIAA